MTYWGIFRGPGCSDKQTSKMAAVQHVAQALPKKGTTKHCAYGICRSDSRFPDRPEMQGVFFVRFPKRVRDEDKCRRWAMDCGRANFDLAKVTKVRDCRVRVDPNSIYMDK